MDKRKRLTLVARTIVPLLILFIIYVVVFTGFGIGLPCIFRTITGLKCPGCGMSHALAAMVHGDFGEAAGENVLSVSLLPVLVVFFIFRFIRYINKGKEDFRIWEIVFLVACLLVCVAFFVLRNDLI
ncbi:MULTISPECIES: DUF2752 domain-containing protein [unclassified Butyrivibrio]|uniref:DUF2752 domain-containing protein n=1 Tax=unclassified Butyrivibrio TaxID=2639466 RepID=UPI0003B58194|nr:MULTISPECIES: DUF2752 domain-containing protein [unclassified Butyrivibrio]MDC7293521.1 DUF2752 domain-containing protein [Butyrivibrio sp. DSM 10294]